MVGKPKAQAACDDRRAASNAGFGWLEVFERRAVLRKEMEIVLLPRRHFYFSHLERFDGGLGSFHAQAGKGLEEVRPRALGTS